jgi:class 3 adenylate cyclase
MKQPVQRRLAAILAADVAGYSRLMGSDEEGTHERVKSHFRELVHPTMTEHRGRIVKNTGDGFLGEFSSVVDAVRCAVELQKAMGDRNAGTAEDQRIIFRVGVNLGDVIAEDDDIYGDGVNIAARLETLAEPGGICISRTVRDQIRDKLPYPFEDRGALNVKNIARPIRVYALGPETVGDLPAPSLPLTLAGARQRELQELESLDAQLELLQAASQAATQTGPVRVDVSRRAGRSRDKRTEKAARFYMDRHGDPLERGIMISALPILADGVLEGLRRILGFNTKGEAATFWLRVYSATLPFIHRRSATLTLKPRGAPDGEVVSWTFSNDGDLVDITPDPTTRGAEAQKAVGMTTAGRLAAEPSNK